MITQPQQSRRNLQDYESIHTKLSDFIEKVNQKINGRIQLVQQVYLDDYKEQVALMSSELRVIKSVLDEQTLKQKSNQKMFYLEEERDFFRAQVVKLNKDLKKLEAENAQMKMKLYESNQECANFKKLVYSLQTKMHKLILENIQIEKLREETLKNVTVATPSAMTPMKGFQSERTLKNQTHREKSRYKQEESEPGQENTLHKQTHYSLRKLKASRSVSSTMNLYQKNTHNSQLSSREEILDNCIKQIKREIFYRNLSGKESNKIHFSQQESVKFSQFTKSDRKELVFKILNNPTVLEDFYAFMTAKDKEVKTKESIGDAMMRLVLAKGIDARTNKKNMDKIKTQFDKRIFDIKANKF